jgi:WD40 repeat protein
MARLRQLWSADIGEVKDLAFSKSGLLGVASDCFHIFDLRGRELLRHCERYSADAVGVSGDLFAVLFASESAVLFSGTRRLKSIEIGYYPPACGAVLFHSTVAFCDIAGYCVAVSFSDGRERLFAELGSCDDIATWRDRLFVADGWDVVVFPRADKIRTGIPPRSLDVCLPLLAVSGRNGKIGVFSVNGTEAEVLWTAEVSSVAEAVAFSPDCRYVAFADSDTGAVKVFSSLTGSEVAVSETESEVTDISWFNSMIAVGTKREIKLLALTY